VDAATAWYREVEEPQGIGVDPATKRPADYFYGKWSPLDDAESGQLSDHAESKTTPPHFCLAVTPPISADRFYRATLC